MRRAPLAVPLVLAALAAGCGAASSATEFEGEERRVAEKVEKIESAGEARNPRMICDEVLAKSLREQIAAAGSSCEQELDKAIKEADDFKLEVEDVSIAGGQATAKVKGHDRGAERVRTFEFVREGNDWRATSLGS